MACRHISSSAFSPSYCGRASRCGRAALVSAIPQEPCSKSSRAFSRMMSCCQPPPTARYVCVASPNPMPHRPLSSTASASSCQSACASPNTSDRPSPQAPDRQLLDQKCSADFSAKPLICLKPTLDSAQVGLILGSGQMGNVHLSPEAEAYFAKKGCTVLLQPTPKAIHTFNNSRAKKIGLFHVTC